MDTTLLKKAGLTESQAKGYLALIEHGSMSPVELAEKAGESRTNGYMIADKLVAFGLATKKDGKKAVYSPTHPSALEVLAERRRKVVQANEQTVKQGVGALIDLYYAHNEQPGVRYLEGKDGLQKIYDDILDTNDELRIVRTPNEKKFFSGELFENFVSRRIKNGIHIKGLTPFTARANTNPAKDAANLFDRQFFPEDMYTAPVEIDVYGSKIGLISFGESLSGVIIDNQHMADALRQVLSLAEIGARVSFEKRPELVSRLNAELAEHAVRSHSIE